MHRGKIVAIFAATILAGAFLGGCSREFMRTTPINARAAAAIGGATTVTVFECIECGPRGPGPRRLPEHPDESLQLGDTARCLGVLTGKAKEQVSRFILNPANFDSGLCYCEYAPQFLIRFDAPADTVFAAVESGRLILRGRRGLTLDSCNVGNHGRIRLWKRILSKLEEMSVRQ